MVCLEELKHAPGGCLTSLRLQVPPQSHFRGLKRGKYSCDPKFRSYIARSPHQVRVDFKRPERFFCRPIPDGRAALILTDNAHYQSAHSEGTKESLGEIKVTGTEELSAAPRCLHAGHDAHPEKAELCPAQSGEGAVDERAGNHSLHPRRRAQPAGAFDRARARGSGEGFARGTLSHRARNARQPRG